MAQYDVGIIGGGILGLATAMEMTSRYDGLSVLVIEKEAGVARHQTGHNSGVIHSGLYYRPGSRKAVMAVRGAEQMVGFAQAHGIAHERCGKVVVATRESQIAALEDLERRGKANGVPGIEALGPGVLREREPHATGVRALHVPSTGIVDFVGVAERFRELTEEKGGEVRFGVEVTGLRAEADGVRVELGGETISVGQVVNCGGLFADRIARLAGSTPAVQIVPFRGEYYDLKPAARRLVANLIYPVPDPAFPFLGVHFTRRIDGRVEAGPNAVLALRREGYRWRDVSWRDTVETVRYPGFLRLASRYWRVGLGEIYRSASKRAFTRALQALVPEVQASDLVRAGSGVRAQALERDGSLADDFRLVEEERMIHVLNAPSPGATASISIGQAITDMAAAWFGEAASKEDYRI